MSKIRHHARRVAHAARRVKGWVWVALGLIIGVFAYSGILYMQESSIARAANITAPAQCMRLTFDENVRACEDALALAYSNVTPLALEPMCNRTRNRAVYGDASKLCSRYDIALAEVLHNDSLHEYGIAVWEPDEVIVANRSINVRSLDTMRTLSLVCDGVLVPTTFDEDIDATVLSFNGTVSGSCQLIATTGQGSVSSEKFNITTS